MWLASISGIYGASNYSMNPLDGLLQTTIQLKLSKRTCICSWQTNHCKIWLYFDRIMPCSWIGNHYIVPSVLVMKQLIVLLYFGKTNHTTKILHNNNFIFHPILLGQNWKNQKVLYNLIGFHNRITIKLCTALYGVCYIIIRKNPLLMK